MRSQRDRAEICVIGLGYIGLPTAVILAEATGSVVGYDTNSEKLTQIADAVLPFGEEDGLEQLLKKVIHGGKLAISNEVVSARCYVIAVPTPISSDKQPDLSMVREAISEIADHLVGDELIIIESTCPPGSTAEIARQIKESRPELSSAMNSGLLAFAYCPERVIPGRILYELVNNDRIVGGLTPDATERAALVYETFCEGNVLKTDAKTAELAKLAENAFRDVNIAFANELESISWKLGVDAREVIRLANQHPRVNILQPGPGVGGHCIAVDPWFLVSASDSPAKLIETARIVNDNRPAEVVERLALQVGKSTPKFLVLGLTYKENVEDLRESPSTKVVLEIIARWPDAKIDVVDPHAPCLPAELQQYSQVRLLKKLPSAMEDYDSLVGLVAHDLFLDTNWESIDRDSIVDMRDFLSSKNRNRSE